MQTVKELTLNFINGETYGSSSNNRLRIDGKHLINYSTIIATRDKENNTIILNGQKYSSTTSKHQNVIRRNANRVLELDTETEFNNYIQKIS